MWYAQLHGGAAVLTIVALLTLVPASELTLADRRRLNLGQAIVRPPALLLLDEPAGGLDAGEDEAVAALLARRVLPGRASLLIDHDTDMLACLCSRFVALDAGQRIAEGTPAEVLSDPGVRRALFGA